MVRGGPLLMLVVALVVAGCAGNAPAPAGSDAMEAAAPPGAALAFDAPVQATDGCGGECFEASVAVDGAGRVVVAGAVTGNLGVSTDGGATFAPVPHPPLPPGAPADSIQSDVLVQTAPSGRLYYSALVRGPVAGTPVTMLVGLQVAWTEDGGASWPVNSYQSALAQPGVHVYAPDRQWLGFGAGETVYMAYNQVPSGIWVARSDDGGRTWGEWVNAASVAARVGGIGQASPPVVDAEGRVYLAATTHSPRALAVFRSDDGGATWSQSDVHGALPEFASWFPSLAVGPDGLVHVAFWYGSGDILVASSTDRGDTWAEPVVWGTSGASSPWVVATPEGGLALAWYSYEGESATLRFARGSAFDGPEAQAVVASGITGGKTTHTDFAHFALLEDGRAVVTWSTGVAAEAFVAVEAIAPTPSAA